jgi:catechol 2,3-dioxygenase
MSTPIHPGVRIGHVHLKVADLERSLAFYCGVLGFQLTQRYGPGAPLSPRVDTIITSA